MNLLELQVLAVVSRIPDGSDAPSPDFDVKPPAGHSRSQRDPDEPAPLSNAAPGPASPS